MQNTFTDFSKHTRSQKDVSLAIAKDEDELKEIVKDLEKDGFRQAVDISDLFKYITKPSRVFFIAKQDLPKDMYDFAVQYPTGQIEIYDNFNLKSKIVEPIYNGVSVVFVITKEVLNKIQKSDFDILEKVGITYQS